jgi:hypothetical protein
MLFCHIVEFVIYKLNIILIKQMLEAQPSLKAAESDCTFFFML